MNIETGRMRVRVRLFLGTTYGKGVDRSITLFRKNVEMLSFICAGLVNNTVLVPSCDNRHAPKEKIEQSISANEQRRYRGGNGRRNQGKDKETRRPPGRHEERRVGRPG